MSTARTFVRLAISGFIVSALGVGCVVDDTNGTSDGCTPGQTVDCTCSDGSASLKECTASGSRYGSCDCPSGAGGSDSGVAGEPNLGGSTNGVDTGGAGTALGGAAASGVAAGGAPAGGAPAGGDASGGLAAVAGAGGAGDEVPLECAEPADDCESCYLAGCCDEYVACVNDDGNDGSGDCSQQFFDILACKDELRSTQDVLPADLKQCALDEVEGGSVWSADLRPAVKPLIDCLAGMAGWENMPWTDSSCNNTCFKQTE